MNGVLRVLVGCSCAMGFTLIAGCGGGPETVDVHGKVTLDGEPLPNAKITFQPEGKGAPSSAVTDEDGYYELQYSVDDAGALIGKHKVYIRTRDDQRDPNGRPIIIPERVPPKYNEQTTLVKEVKPGGNEIDFPLEGALQ